MADNKRWVVTLSNKRPLKDVTQEMAQTGFQVDQVLDAIGCVTGAASDEVANKLRAVSGVEDVSPEAGIDIGPPDANPTW
ncbi:hypothetical protein GCM10027299_23530 [Larkinella ripae]